MRKGVVDEEHQQDCVFSLCIVVSEYMAQSPKGGLYGSQSKRHLQVCATYSETTVIDWTND